MSQRGTYSSTTPALMREFICVAYCVSDGLSFERRGEGERREEEKTYASEIPLDA